MKTALALTLASSALVAAPPAGTGDGLPASQTSRPAIAATKLAGMNKVELKKLLARVGNEKVPMPKMGAMCYKMALPPDRLEYVCPVCGEKTLYAQAVSHAWNRELNACRRVFNEMPKQDTMTLDESCFCKKCQPEAKELLLKLTLRFDDGTSHTTAKITSDDLRLLRDFLAGKLLVAGEQDDETPIKSNLSRLKQLLGLSAEQKTPSPKKHE